MRLLGLNISRKGAGTLSPVDDRGSSRSWFPWILEANTGDWQKNKVTSVDTVLEYPPVFACVALITADFGKLRPKLVQWNQAAGITVETRSAAFSPVLRSPNNYQNHIQFKEAWINSKLCYGNAYVLKEYDARGAVTGLHVLDPRRVTVLVATDGSVFYQLLRDDLSGLFPDEGITVPAAWIIHDRFNCLYHPLVGLSPIMAALCVADTGRKMQENSALFFANGARPGGILTAPGAISNETANRLKTTFDEKYTGRNAGKTVVVGDGLTYAPMTMSAVDAQLIAQMKWTAEQVASVFHVPAYKIGAGVMPTGYSVESIAQDYYSQCLQTLIESFELCLSEGIGIGLTGTNGDYTVELDLDGLLRMDRAALITSVVEAVKGAIMSPNDGRRLLGLLPAPGGDSPMIQQQNFSLAALAKRDALPNPFLIDKPTPVVEEAANTAPSQVTDKPDAAAGAESANKDAGEWYAKALDALALELTT